MVLQQGKAGSPSCSSLLVTLLWKESWPGKLIPGAIFILNLQDSRSQQTYGLLHPVTPTVCIISYPSAK